MEKKLNPHSIVLPNPSQLMQMTPTLHICLTRDAGLIFYSEKLKDKQS